MPIKNESDVIDEANKLIAPTNPGWNPPAEWIETNGIGGWSSSGILGCHTRRYHGLLVAATKPPTERFNLLSKLDETIVVNDKRFELSANVYGNDYIHPNGYQYLKTFSKVLFPEWVYEADKIQLKKSIVMIHGENTVVKLYEVLKAPSVFSFELLPLVSAKPNHALQHSSTNIWWDVQFENGIFHNKPFEESPDIFISVPGSSYQHNPKWFYNFNYLIDKYRGQEFEEDLFNHGTISVELKEGDLIGIIISTENPVGRNAIELFDKEKQRRLSLLNETNQPSNISTLQLLALAADQFIVKRGEDLKTIIAGYHWFTDWSRDTMISLPGLCLSAGRYDDAKKILVAFAKSVSMGMLPNRFQDNNEPPEYNNVDGTLWYFIAIKKYLDATGDNDFILKEILPVLKEIIDWHFKGTRYNIHVDEDGLLYAGEKGQQLTWMDARIGDWVVTPRMGKPVEIQALWYNSLKIFSELLRMNNQQYDAELVEISAAKAKQNFEEKYWNADRKYLYDNIDETGIPDASLRPNQLFALGLCYHILDDAEKAESILKIVEEKLYTPVGLRSLSPGDEKYIAVYGGDQFKRDASYHQGIVWSWLLGAYVDAIVKIQGSRHKAQEVIDNFKYHLNEGCIGSVSEIFDADEPHYPRGCAAQAWGVAEILRVIKQYGLE
ncbi:MAG TPA: amylo-alpha-1,6-glucosidase [Puia sp.]|nr:amylo-alpha-1,6-glucosidase [Puia sp.]